MKDLNTKTFVLIDCGLIAKIRKDFFIKRALHDGQKEIILALTLGREYKRERERKN